MARATRLPRRRWRPERRRSRPVRRRRVRSRRGPAGRAARVRPRAACRAGRRPDPRRGRGRARGRGRRRPWRRLPRGGGGPWEGASGGGARRDGGPGAGRRGSARGRRRRRPAAEERWRWVRPRAWAGRPGAGRRGSGPGPRQRRARPRCLRRRGLRRPRAPAGPRPRRRGRGEGRGRQRRPRPALRRPWAPERRRRGAVFRLRPRRLLLPWEARALPLRSGAGPVERRRRRGRWRRSPGRGGIGRVWGAR
jgi:hypothetical protein